MSLAIEIQTLKKSLLSVITKDPLNKTLAIPSFLSYNHALRALFFVFSISYIMLVMHLPVSIYTGAIHDGALYWGNARSIIGGHWLGAYNQMTLAKGPGFPLFLAVNALIGIPITLSIALFYLFACRLLTNTLRELGLNNFIVLILFVVMLFHPYLFLMDIIRDNIYPALSLIIISGVIRLVFTPRQQDKQLNSVIPYGLVFGFFWITREEGIWIIPSLLLLLSFKTLQLKKQNLAIKTIFYRFTYFSLVAIIFVSLIAFINYYNYGKFEVVDFKGTAYSQAFKSLNSVDVGKELPYLPVSSKKRQIIYTISPSFVQLKDYFDNKGRFWTVFGCSLYSWTCDDYAGGWFAWALRDAVADKGYYQNPVRAAEFYNNITKEIQTACDSGTIKCKTNPVPFMPNIARDQLKKFPERIVDAIKFAMVQFPTPDIGSPSWEPLDLLQKTRLFLGNPRTVPALSEEKTELNGWFYSVNDDWIVLNCVTNGLVIKKTIDRISSPDLTEYFKDPKANFQRFSISVLNNENCSISTESLRENILPIKSLSEQQTTYRIGNGTLQFGQISQSSLYSKKYFPLKVKSSLVKIYKQIVPALVTFGAFVYVIYLMFILVRKTPVTDIFIISTMLWCLFFSRIVLLVLVDISSFPGINSTYMSAAFPILCLAAFLSLQLIFSKSIKPTVCIST
jgi:hypothetical protein